MLVVRTIAGEESVLYLCNLNICFSDPVQVRLDAMGKAGSLSGW